MEQGWGTFRLEQGWRGVLHGVGGTDRSRGGAASSMASASGRLSELQGGAGVEGRPPWRRGHGPEQGWSGVLHGVGVRAPERATELRGGSGREIGWCEEERMGCG